jgi:hypothetical protein
LGSRIDTERKDNEQMFALSPRFLLARLRRKTGQKPANLEALERLAVQLLELAERCTDVPIQRDLRNLATDLVKVIEGCDQFDQPEKARQSR